METASKLHPQKTGCGARNGHQHATRPISSWSSFALYIDNMLISGAAHAQLAEGFYHRRACAVSRRMHGIFGERERERAHNDCICTSLFTT